MSKKYHRKNPSKDFRIKTIRDAIGEDWDAYEEKTAINKMVIYRGWQYGCTPADEGISPVFSYILTEELAELIKAHPIQYVHEQTGLSLSIIGKMRIKLGINRKFVYRNDVWILANQDALLNESYSSLKEKFQLTRPQINQHREWLAEMLDIKKRERLRNTDHDDENDEWFKKEYINLKGLSIEDLMSKYNISKYLAKKAHDKYQKMNDGLTYSELIKNMEIKWLVSNKDLLLSGTKTIPEIAKIFNKSDSQICRMRRKLRTELEKIKFLIYHIIYIFKIKCMNIVCVFCCISLRYFICIIQI